MLNKMSQQQPAGCFAAFLAVVLLFVFSGPPAAALVYWTTFGGDIGRANLDGSVANTEWISSSGAPTGIAVDGSYVYWARFFSDTVGRANIDGSGATNSWITGPVGPNGIAVDASYVYWANTDDNTIGRANLDGSGANQSWISGGTNPTGLVVDANYVYWTNYSSGAGTTIGRANIDGTGVNDSFISGATAPSGIAVDGSYVYWTNFGSSGSIGRANLDGSGANQSFVTGVVNSIGMAVDANYIYWTTADDIGRANIDGSGGDATWIENVGSNTRGIAVDATATPIDLVRFVARGVQGDVKVVWETAAEIDTAGFHIWRRDPGEEDFVRVTGKMIPAEGNPFQGATYRWIDMDAGPGVIYWYKLEDIDHGGISAFHGPIRTMRKLMHKAE